MIYGRGYRNGTMGNIVSFVNGVVKSAIFLVTKPYTIRQIQLTTEQANLIETIQNDIRKLHETRTLEHVTLVIQEHEERIRATISEQVDRIQTVQNDIKQLQEDRTLEHVIQEHEKRIHATISEQVDRIQNSQETINKRIYATILENVQDVTTRLSTIENTLSKIIDDVNTTKESLQKQLAEHSLQVHKEHEQIYGSICNS